ncbi:MAG: cytochrome c peroxidase [Saprospiraceae bacterium]
MCFICIIANEACNSHNLNYEPTSKDLFQVLSAKNNGIKSFILPESNDLEQIPQDTSNPLSTIKIELGKFIFFDPALSFDPKCKAAAQTFSCASCHFADAGFQAGIKQSIAGGGQGHGLLRHRHPSCDTIDLDLQMLRTPSIVNSAYQEVQLWSGKLGSSGPNKGTDSLWPKGSFVELNRLGMQGVETQARVALEAHGIRMNPTLITQTKYGSMFDSAFNGVDPRLKYRRFTMAKAIAAYERTVLTNQAPFQQWLKGDSNTMTKNQIKGALLFFGKAGCDHCHTGSALNSMNFFALGVNDMEGEEVIQKLDAPADTKLGRAGFTHLEQDNFKFKVPQLYNLKNLEFLGHGGGFCSIEEVIRYKNNGIPQNPNVNKKYIDPLFKPLHLNDSEIKALCDFIENALYDPNLKRYEPYHVPSGFCFPNADKMSKIQLHCP